MKKRTHLKFDIVTTFAVEILKIQDLVFHMKLFYFHAFGFK